MQAFKLNNVHLFYGDGFAGLPPYAPFDGIIVTAAPTHVPQALLDQLAEGGRLVLPLDNGMEQILTVVERQGKNFPMTPITSVRFVPMLSGQEM